MKILLDKEFKEIQETIEMYKDKYNEAIEDYYKCDKMLKNAHNKYTKELEENFFLQNKINEVIDDLQKTLKVNKHIKMGNNELVQLDIDHIKYLIDKLKGEENEKN